MEHKSLIKIRKSKGITQKQMAHSMSMEQTTYSKKERGISSIRDEEWVRIAELLGVTVDEIRETKTFSGTHGFITKFKLNDIHFVTIPENVFNIIIKYNSKLEEENDKLKSEIVK